MFAGLASPTHLILLLVIILLLFGAKRLPEMGRSLAQGIKEFKGGLNAQEEPEKEEHPEAIEEQSNARAQQRSSQEEKVISHAGDSEPPSTH